jgi:hypothetical protein
VNPRTRPTLLLPWHHLLLALLIVLSACTPARRRGDPNLAVLRSVHFEGNGGPLSGHNDLQLRQQMEIKPSKPGVLMWPLMYLVEPQYFDRTTLMRDAYRLEVWYAHHGFFDARVVGWEARRARNKGENRAAVLDVVGIVEPGPQSLISEYRIEGMDRPALKLLASTLKTKGWLRAGDPFDLELAEHDRDMLADLLRNHGYAYAQVDLQLRADPVAKNVVMTLTAVPGISTRFGDMTIRGNRRIPSHFITEVLTLETGQGYSRKDLVESQRQIFEMGTFSLVRVDPDLRDPTRADVPVNIRVTESKWRTVRLGVGSDGELIPTTPPVDAFGNEIDVDENTLFDGVILSPRVGGSVRHTNLLRQLIRFETSGSVGLTYPVGDKIVDVIQRPSWSIKSSLSYPRIGGQGLTLQVTGSAVQDTRDGVLHYRRFLSDWTVQIKPGKAWQFGVGPHVEQYCFLLDDEGLVTEGLSCPTGAIESADSRRITRALFGESFENPYVVTALDQTIVYDHRFKASEGAGATRGRYGSFRLREAVPLTPTSQAFLGMRGDGRLYTPLRFNKARSYALGAAFAVRGEWLIPFGTTPVPYPERAFLGGANSIRGFRSQQVGPYRTACAETVEENVDGDTYCPQAVHQPDGGTLAVQTSAELRYPWAYGITFAAFVDIGSLSEGWSDWSTKHLRTSVGVGARYDTLIGPVRFDISARPIYEEDRTRTLSDDMLKADLPPDSRTYDFLSSWDQWRDPADRPIPLAVVFYIAIGEAI